MVTYTLTTPVSVGSISSLRTISTLRITGVAHSLTPELAPLGAGSMTVTLTDPKSGAQEKISYCDATVPALLAAAQTPAANTALGDILALAVFRKLIKDGKLPAGILATE